MNKQKSIAAWKRIQAAAADAMLVATQTYNNAARLESEALSALEELAAPKAPRRKVHYELSAEEQLKMKAQMTRGAKHQA